MRNFVWISFDLGLKGDYEGMFTWLNQQRAKECGDNLACFWYEHRSNDLLVDLKSDLNRNVEIDEKKTRIYVIRLVRGKMKGTFIFGRRHSPAWEGFGATGEDEEDTNE